MEVEYLKVLLAAAEEMLISASNLPKSSSRTGALQMVQAYVSNIALLMNAIEAWPEGNQMKPDDQNDLDWALIAGTVIVGIALVAFFAYALFVYLDLSSVGSRLPK
jgi:hypothetical protein